mgnify:FL=1
MSELTNEKTKQKSPGPCKLKKTKYEECIFKTSEEPAECFHVAKELSKCRSKWSRGLP